MNKMVMKLLVGLLFLFSTVCFAQEGQASAEPTVYTQDKLAVTVTPDKPEFIIKLKSNPTTGYSWFLREYDGDMMTPVKHQFQHATSQLVGAPGFELWTFKMKKEAFTVPQQTIVRFVYARPWNSTDASQMVIFRVTTTSVPSASHSQK